MSRLIRGAAAAAGLAVAVIPLLLIYPPEPLLRVAARRVLPPSVLWSDAERSGTRCALLNVDIPVSGALRIRAERAVLTRTALEGVLSGVWHFEVRKAEVIPGDGRWSAIRIPALIGRWSSAERRLALEDPSASGLRLSADLRWTPDGKLNAARIDGFAGPAELEKLLSAWKKFTPDADPKSLPFTIGYERGGLLITVDGKPFFKASWRSDASF